MFICSSVLWSPLIPFNVDINLPIDPVNTSILFSMDNEFAVSIIWYPLLSVTILADEEDDVDDLAVILELLEPSFSEEAISLVDTDSFEDALSVVLFSAHLFEGNGLSLQVSSLSIRWICLFFLSHKTNDCPSAVMRDLTME